MSELRRPLLEGPAPRGAATNVDAPKSSKGLREAPVYLNMREDHVESFRKEYGIEPILQTSSPVNLHPHMAYQRGALEHWVVKYITKNQLTCMDVGGAPQRLRDVPGMRHLVPQLQPGDAGRLRGFETANNVCTHKLEQYLEVTPDHPGTCKNCQGVHVMLFTHSGYYFSPKVLARAIESCKEKEIFVIGHIFEGVDGTFGSEGFWTVRNGRVQMRVDGNRHTYNHGLLPWNSEPTFTVDGVVYEAEEVQSYSFTTLWRVYRTMLPVVIEPPDERRWTSILLDPTHRGVIRIPDVVTGLSQSRLLLEERTISVTNIIGQGSVLECGIDHVTVIIPRGAIGYVATQIVGRERDRALVQTAIYYAKRYLDKTSVPRDDMPGCVAAVAFLALSINIHNEILLAHHSATHMAGLWRMHSTLMQLHPLKTLSVYWLLLAFVASITITTLLDHYVPTPHHIIGYVMLGLIILTISVFSLTFYLRLRAIRLAGEGWRDQFTRRGTTAIVSEPTPLPVVAVGPANVFKPLEPLAEGARVTVGDDPRPPRSAEPVSQLQVTGLVPDRVGVTYAPSDQMAELVAVRNRITSPVREPEAIAVEGYVKAYEAPEFDLLRNMEPIIDDEALAKKWARRLPCSEGEKVRMLELWKVTHIGGPKTVKTDLRVFTKADEKLPKVGLEGQEPITPRTICAVDDTHKAFTGPFMWEFANRVASLWDGVKSVFYYVRGQSAEEVGRTFGDWYDRNGEANFIAFEDDFRMYDKTLSGVLQEPIDDLYEATGATLDMMEVVRSEETFGCTTHGVKFTAGPGVRQINSGKNETNVKGTIGNAAAHAYAYGDLDVEKGDLMLLNGDDNTLFRCLNRSRAVNEDLVAKNLRDLGLEPTLLVRTRIADVEFCSKIFLPTGDGWVLSPKPGRAMTKLGWSLRDKSPEQLLGETMGLKKDGHHVPFLRVVIRHTLRLIPRDVKPKKAPDKRPWEIHARQYHECVPSTWAIFTERYGLTEADEVKFDELLSGITKLPAVYPCEDIVRLFEVDLA